MVIQKNDKGKNGHNKININTYVILWYKGSEQERKNKWNTQHRKYFKIKVSDSGCYLHVINSRLFLHNYQHKFNLHQLSSLNTSAN